jgi:hypothetical protein
LALIFAVYEFWLLPVRKVLRAEPMIPLEVFKDKDVCICNFNSLVGGMVLFGVFYFSSVYFTVVHGFSPQKAGGALIYFLPGMGVGTYLGLVLIFRVLHDTKWVIVFGAVVLAVANGLYTMAIANDSLAQVYGFMAMMGCGVALGFMPTQIHSQKRMMHHLAAVTSMISFWRAFGGSVGLSIQASVTNNLVARDTASLGLSTSAGPQNLNELSQLSPAAAEAVRSAFSNAIRWSYIALLPFCCLSAVTAFFLGNMPTRDPPAAEATATEKSESSEDPSEKTQS